MKVFKCVDDRQEDIARLTHLLGCKTTQEQSQRIKKEIAIIKKGVQGEKSTAFALESYFSESSIVSHGLRLDLNGEVAQIDHLLVNKHGAITILETKNFSNDVMIDDDGVFHFKRNGEFRPFPSPIEQANRQALVLRKIINEIGFNDIGIIVLVVFGYGSKIYKPKKGYECVCYPDMIKRAHNLSVDNISTLEILKVTGTLIGNKLYGQKITPEEFMSNLVEKYHKPINVDFEGKFGLSKSDCPDLIAGEEKQVHSNESINNDLLSDENINVQALTLTKISKLVGLSKEVFLTEMVMNGLIEIRENGKEYPTALGRQNGISLKKGKFGYFLSFDFEKIQKFRNTQNKAI